MHRLALCAVAIILLVLPVNPFADEIPEDAPRQQVKMPAADTSPSAGPATQVGRQRGDTPGQTAAGHLEGPPPEEIEARFQLVVPGYWSLSDFTLVASADYGTAVEPVIKHRFIAQVQLREDTFTVEAEGGFVAWITPVAEAGNTWPVYGIATSILHAGTWQTEFELENQPMANKGQPRGFFEGRVIARGSEEEERHLAELAAKRQAEAERVHQEELAGRRRAEELREQERKAELTRVAHKEKVSEEEQEHRKREADAAAAELEALLAELTERAKSRLAVDLPGYWELVGFEADEAALSEENGAPLVEREFSATLELVQDTFAEVEDDGPVVLVAPVAEAGATRNVHGVLRARRSGNAWDVGIDLENEPMAQTGQPRDFFEGRVIVRGTPQEEAHQQEKLQAELAERQRQEALEEQERQAELARMAAEEKKREQERQAELARLEYERRLREEQQKVELARAAFEVELQKRNEEKEAAMRAAEEREIAVFRAALASDDIGVRTRAVKAALVDNDEAMRIAALQSALDSDDPALERLAMLDVITRRRTISGTFSTQDRTYEGSVTIGLANFSNSRDGVVRFDGTLGGSSFSHYRDDNRKVVGTISGTQFDLGNKYCSLSLGLGGGAVMVGKMSCENIQLGERRRETTTVDVEMPLF